MWLRSSVAKAEPLAFWSDVLVYVPDSTSTWWPTGICSARSMKELSGTQAAQAPDCGHGSSLWWIRTLESFESDDQSRHVEEESAHWREARQAMCCCCSMASSARAGLPHRAALAERALRHEGVGECVPADPSLRHRRGPMHVGPQDAFAPLCGEETNGVSLFVGGGFATTVGQAV